MEVITLESTAFAKLLENLEELTSTLQKQTEEISSNTKNKEPVSKPILGDKWLDTEEVCQLLKVTKRTLQNYRDGFLIPYSQIGKKILYKASDVQALLDQNYVSLDE